jgi:hypothetical protein
MILPEKEKPSTFFECSEDRHTGRGDDDVVLELQARGTLDSISRG